MRVSYEENFIHIEFFGSDFAEDETGRSLRERFTDDLKDIFDTEDEGYDFDTQAKIWLVADTPKNRAIVRVLEKHHLE